MGILLFLSFFCPIVISAQQFYFQSAHQLDAEEVSIVHFFGDEEALIFVNHLSELSINGDTVFNQGDYDFTPLLFDGQELGVADILNSDAYEKGIAYSIDESQNKLYLDMAFQDSLEAFINSADPILLSSNYGRSVATIHANDVLNEFVVSYFHFIDSTDIKSSLFNENVIHAGRFRDSILLENSEGEIETRYGNSENSLFISQKDINGDLLWVNVIAAGSDVEIAALHVEDDILYMLTNQSGGTKLRKFNAGTGVLLDDFIWEDATLVHFVKFDNKYYLSGSVDTDAQGDLDFSENEYILPSGNGYDGVLLSYDQEMNLGWVQHISGTNDSHITHFDFSDIGVLYATGSISGESTFGPDNTLMVSNSNKEMFLAHYTAIDGSFEHAEKYSGNGNSSGTHIKVIEVFENIVDIILLAEFNGQLNVNVEEEEVLFEDNYEQSDLSYIIFSLFYEDNVIISTKSTFAAETSISPVPTLDLLNIEIDKSSKVKMMELIDIYGQRVRSYSGFNSSIETNFLKSGNYILRLYTEQGIVLSLIHI